jgi:N-acetylglucosamine kinase-like BadF-type ATPase
MKHLFAIAAACLLLSGPALVQSDGTRQLLADVEEMVRQAKEEAGMAPDADLELTK